MSQREVVKSSPFAHTNRPRERVNTELSQPHSKSSAVYTRQPLETMCQRETHRDPCRPTVHPVRINQSFPSDISPSATPSSTTSHPTTTRSQSSLFNNVSCSIVVSIQACQGPLRSRTARLGPGFNSRRESYLLHLSSTWAHMGPVGQLVAFLLCLFHGGGVPGGHEV